MNLKINHDNNDLWCIESKERINIGEKYVEVVEDDIIKTYKFCHAPIDDETDEPYIG